MLKKVVYARLQTEAYVTGAGSLGTVFPPQSKTLEGLDMSVEEVGLTIKFTYRGFKKELLIPLGNVVLMEVISEEKKAVK